MTKQRLDTLMFANFCVYCVVCGATGLVAGVAGLVGAGNPADLALCVLQSTVLSVANLKVYLEHTR